MTERTIIALGYAQGELLPPYRNKREEKEAKNILKYIKGKKAVLAPVSIHFNNYKEYFEEGNFPRQVEIVGSWLEQCVQTTLDFCLSIGAEVLINPKYVISYHGRKNNGKAVFLKEDLRIPEIYERGVQRTPSGLILKQNRIFTKRNMLASA